jgi:hypothetical protein
METEEHRSEESASADEPGAEEAGTADEHSDAPGETGTGGREPDPEHGKPARP